MTEKNFDLSVVPTNVLSEARNIISKQKRTPKSPGVVRSGSWQLCAALSVAVAAVQLEQGPKAARTFAKKVCQGDKGLVVDLFESRGWGAELAQTIFKKNDSFADSRRSEGVLAMLRGV